MKLSFLSSKKKTLGNFSLIFIVLFTAVTGELIPHHRDGMAADTHRGYDSALHGYGPSRRLQAGTVITKVFNDIGGSNNQFLDNGNSEPGVANIIVELLDADSNHSIALTTTDSDGFATFNDVPTAGNLMLKYGPLPPGATFIGQNNDNQYLAKNSDVVDITVTALGALGTTAPFAVPSNAIESNIDAGARLPGTVQAKVFNDINGDGLDNNNGEPGVPGVKVEVIDANDPTTGYGSRYTDATGVATIPDVPTDKDLRLKFGPLPEGITFVPDTHTNFNVGGNKEEKDSDVDPVTGITKDTFKLTFGSATFKNFDAGVNLPGTVQTKVFNDKNGDGLDNNNNEDGVPGVKVDLLVCSTISSETDNNGFATFTNVPTGKVLMLKFDEPSRSKFTPQFDRGATNPSWEGKDSDANPSTGLTSTFMLTSGSQTIGTFDAGVLMPGTVEAKVFNDINSDGLDNNNNEPGVPGVKVEVIDASDETIVYGQSVTNATGFATIRNIPAGVDLKLKFGPLPEGITFVPDTHTNFNAGGNKEEKDSDVNPVTGITVDTFKLNTGSETFKSFDAGIVTSNN
jgi:hypothetical protein